MEQKAIEEHCVLFSPYQTPEDFYNRNLTEKNARPIGVIIY